MPPPARSPRPRSGRRTAASSAMELLICDCDGVLVDSEIIAMRVVERELAARLPDVDVPSLVYDTAGMTTAAILERVQRHTQRALPGGTLEQIRLAVDRALDEELEPLPGVRMALDTIRMAKAVVSNSSLPRVKHALARAELTAVFGERVFSADSVAKPKPAPDVYRHAANALAAPPARCLVVEDSVTGVTAARLAGMSVIGFTGASHVVHDQEQRLLKVGALAVIDRMDLLPELVDSWSVREV